LIISLQPATFHIERSIVMTASPAAAFAQVNDFHAWQAWSPWEKLDPAMQRTFSGAQSGEGAVYSWKGNSDVGAGRMEILEVVPAQKVAIKLDFSEPMESSSITNFTLQPQGTATTVTWNMSGPMPFLSKVMSVFASMDKMIGKDFEKGLSQLKAEAEK
jgi:uncharacterized protein YndB with AHSA1/START domain